MKIQKFVKILLLTTLVAGGVDAAAQTSDIGIMTNLALGEVAMIDSKNLIRIKTKDGSIDAVLDSSTEFKRVSPNEPTNLAAAVQATLSEIGAGDRIIAQGAVSSDKRIIKARRIILLTKADIGKIQSIEREKWLMRGVAGRIAALNATAKEITLNVRNGSGDERSTIVAADVKTIFRRYAPDSVRFKDALPSDFGELKVGDQLRARGEKSADGTRLAAAEIVFGSFRMVAGQITAVEVATGEVRITDLQTKKEMVVVVNGNTLLRRFPAEIAARLAQSQTAKTNKSSSQQQPQNSTGNQTSITDAPRDERDLDAVLEQMPVLNLSGLKVGDAIAASCIASASAPDRLTAVKFIAGVEPFLTLKQNANQRQQRGAPSFNIPGLEGISAP